MLTVALALALRDAGLRWRPAPGDRFVLPHRGMDEETFVLSDMTVEVYQFPTGAVIGFNGTTEWALDSVEQSEALWIPAEEQLRSLLAGMFLRLEAGPPVTVTIRTAQGERQYQGGHDVTDPTARAYGLALLAVLRDLS